MNWKSSVDGEGEESRRMRSRGNFIVGEDEDCVWVLGGEISDFEECVVCVYVFCLGKRISLDSRNIGKYS
jgi:hypothetical protein